MPNKKITEFPVATEVDPSDLLLVVQGGVTKQVTHDTVAAAVAASTEMTATYVALASTPPDHTKVLAYVDISVSPPALKGWNGTTWVAIGGTVTPAIATTVNGDGTFTATGSGVTDNGDGTITFIDSSVSDNGDGTFTLAA